MRSRISKASNWLRVIIHLLRLTRSNLSCISFRNISNSMEEINLLNEFKSPEHSFLENSGHKINKAIRLTYKAADFILPPYCMCKVF